LIELQANPNLGYSFYSYSYCLCFPEKRYHWHHFAHMRSRPGEHRSDSTRSSLPLQCIAEPTQDHEHRGRHGTSRVLSPGSGETLPARYAEIQSLWLPTIKTQLALNRRKLDLSLNTPQAASTALEFGQIPFANNLSCLYHLYVRGEAYLEAGQGNAATAAFQKILDHSGIVWNWWTGALAHLGVARANSLEARTSQGADADAARVRALAAYKDFLTLWKDADPDIPILKEAKTEYAKLQ
jgi:hypothetical protein